MMSWTFYTQMRNRTQASLFSGMKLRSEIIEFFVFQTCNEKKNEIKQELRA